MPEIVTQADEKLCQNCGSIIKILDDICQICGVNQLVAIFSKGRATAAFLAFFVGALGVHVIYLGKTSQAFFYLAFFWTLFPTFLASLDFFALLRSPADVLNAKYHVSPRTE